MFNYILYRIGEFLALKFPLNFSNSLAKMLSNLQYLISKNDRTLVRNNLLTILPDKPKEIIEQYTREVFINFGKYLVEFFRFSNLNKNYIKNNISIEGLEHIDKSLTFNRGLIIVSAHVGNWELGAVTLGVLGYKVNAVALPHKHKKVNAFFNSQRESNGVKVVPLGRAVKSCLEAFNRNEIVCLVGDRDFTQGGIIIDLFGKPTMIPKGPAAFSLKNRTPIIAGFTIRKPDNKFLLSFNPPIEFNSSSDYENDIITLTKLYLKQIEACISKYPNQWCMFRKFWL